MSPLCAGLLSNAGATAPAEAVAAAAAGAGPASAWSLWDSGEWWMLLAAQSMAVGTVMAPWVRSLFVTRVGLRKERPDLRVSVIAPGHGTSVSCHTSGRQN